MENIDLENANAQAIVKIMKNELMEGDFRIQEAAWLKKTDKETLQKEQNDYWIMASLPARDTSAALDIVSQ